MPSVQEERAIRNINRNLPRFSQGSGVEETQVDLTLNDKVQWWKPDGTPLPTLLPMDDYNRAVFQGNGWTMHPPRNPVEVQEVGLSPIEQEIQRARDKAAEKAAGQGISPIETEVQREIRGKAQNLVIPETATHFNFLEPAPTEQPQPEVLPCEEPDCDFMARGRTKKFRKASLSKHTYGPRSKHKKEKS